MLYLFEDSNNRSHWTQQDKLDLAQRVENYLKFDGSAFENRQIINDLDDNKRRITLSSGRTIQYVNQCITSKHPDGTHSGFFDEIVWVAQSYESEMDENPERHLIGMEWNNNLNAKLNLIDIMSNKELEQIVFATAMHDSMKNQRFR